VQEQAGSSNTTLSDGMNQQTALQHATQNRPATAAFHAHTLFLYSKQSHIPNINPPTDTYQPSMLLTNVTVAIALPAPSLR
jgi:hypothetical protein